MEQGERRKEPLSLLRLRRELEEGVETPEGSSLKLLDKAEGGENVVAQLLYETTVSGGPYDAQRYRFVIDVPKKYPFYPPKARCVSPIFHPSVDEEGRVCINITREDWSLRMGVQHVVFGIACIFQDVAVDDPLNAEAGELAARDRKEFKRRVDQRYFGGLARN